jgi:hypothetical protein
MLVALRPMLVMLAAVRHVAGLVSPRRLAGHTIHRSKHWPSDGIIRQVYLAAASIAVVALLTAATVSPLKMVWGIASGPLKMVWG